VLAIDATLFRKKLEMTTMAIACRRLNTN